MKKRPQPTPVIRPSVVFQPDLLAGVAAMAGAVRPTLGPLPRTVSLERSMRNRAPEVMDDAAIIARRIVQIPHPTADVGAMLLRQAMWTMHQQVGDGAATTAVLAEAMLRHAARAAASGIHPMWLRAGIEAGVSAVCHELRRTATPLPAGKAGRKLLSALAHCLSPDRELTEELVGIVANVGIDGAVEVVVGQQRSTLLEYIEGAMWDYGWLSGAFCTDSGRTIARIEEAAVLLVDDAISSRELAARTLEHLIELGVARAVIIANNVADEAMPVFMDAHHRQAIRLAMARSPFIDAERIEAMKDLAALTGGQIVPHAGSLPSVALDDLGEVSRFWTTEKKFGVIAGSRDLDRMRERIGAARAEIARCKNTDDLPKLRRRLARLTGGHAILHVGGVSQQAAETRRDHAIRLAQTLQSAAGSGVVAGGGAAYLGCLPALEKLIQTGSHSASGARLQHADQSYGVRCVALALEAPMAALAHNAGLQPSTIVAQVRAAGDGHGVDVLSGRLARMMDRGIIDSLSVIERAIQTAGSAAAMAITTAAVVHHRTPQVAVRP